MTKSSINKKKTTRALPAKQTTQSLAKKTLSAKKTMRNLNVVRPGTMHVPSRLTKRNIPAGAKKKVSLAVPRSTLATPPRHATTDGSKKTRVPRGVRTARVVRMPTITASDISRTPCGPGTISGPDGKCVPATPGVVFGADRQTPGRAAPPSDYSCQTRTPDGTFLTSLITRTRVGDTLNDATLGSVAAMWNNDVTISTAANEQTANLIFAGAPAPAVV